MTTDPIKLSQEAFRLFRTAQNLLNLKEPSLGVSKTNLMDIKEPHYATIQRKLNSRESRLSIQSSTDDSVHSTTSSSSRNETDEENLSPFCILPQQSSSTIPIREKSVASSMDDESGFSSMNSFQEIGLPVSSTMSTTSSSSTDEPNLKENIQNEKRSNKLTINHRRWSSAPPIPPKLHLSAALSDDEPLQVLWV